MATAVPADPPPFRVLVCDDRHALRTTITRVLANTPLFEVVAEAEDGPGCIEQVLQARPDLLILDVNVPGGGPHVARAVKDIDPGLYVLVYTSHRDPDIQQQMLDAGADAYLVKTGRLASLIHALNVATAHLAATPARRPAGPTLTQTTELQALGPSSLQGRRA